MRFVCGPEKLIPAEQLRPISAARFAEEITNHTHLENYFLVRVYGRAAWPRFGMRLRQDADGIWNISQPAGDDNVFIPDDFEPAAMVLTAEEARGRSDTVDCVVTRRNSWGG